MSDKLKKLRKKLEKNTSRDDHKKPLSQEEQRYKEENNQHVKDNEGRNKDTHKEDEH